MLHEDPDARNDDAADDGLDDEPMLAARATAAVDRVVRDYRARLQAGCLGPLALPAAVREHLR
jgi:hypothetical protein